MPEWTGVATRFPLRRWVGSVTRVHALGIEAQGPKVMLGEECDVQLPCGRTARAEVVSLQGSRVVLMPYGDTKGLAVGAEVVALGEPPRLRVGDALLGHVIDAFGSPLDGQPLPHLSAEMPLRPPPLNPLHRTPIQSPLITGVRAIDAVLPLGRGQRMGVFAGSGVGKTSLMGMLARGVEADVNVVALIGERGREVQEFLGHVLTEQARRKTVVVVATADQPAVVRARAAYAATAVAEYFRESGKQVFLLMDSITRFAMARREIDIASGHPPTARGYTPSVFSEIPALCERCGASRSGGSITALYTVLVEGDDHNEPISDTVRATLDGHIVLSRDLAHEGHYPAIDVLQSVSRLDGRLLSKDQQAMAARLRSLLATHRKHSDMVDMGLYKAGGNALLDEALARWQGIRSFLLQGLDEVSSRASTNAQLQKVLSALGDDIK
jgi:flagellum-specific ATP synthase